MASLSGCRDTSSMLSSMGAVKREAISFSLLLSLLFFAISREYTHVICLISPAIMRSACIWPYNWMHGARWTPRRTWTSRGRRAAADPAALVTAAVLLAPSRISRLTVVPLSVAPQVRFNIIHFHADTRESIWCHYQPPLLIDAAVYWSSSRESFWSLRTSYLVLS